MKTSTLRPGLLVSLKTSVTGNVSYTKRDLERAHSTKDGKQKAKWETERTISDPAEFEEASKVRSRVRTLITSVCSASAFGLLCPEADRDTLVKAIEEARHTAEAFNETAALTRIGVYVIAGRVAADDVEAVRAINSEIRELMADMATGLQNLEVDEVRKAANKARDLGAMLNSDAEMRVRAAIELARQAARKIAAAGEQGAAEIDKVSIRKITELRTAFLDFGDDVPISAPSIAGRALDLSPLEVE